MPYKKYAQQLEKKVRRRILHFQNAASLDSSEDVRRENEFELAREFRTVRSTMSRVHQRFLARHPSESTLGRLMTAVQVQLAWATDLLRAKPSVFPQRDLAFSPRASDRRFTRRLARSEHVCASSPRIYLDSTAMMPLPSPSPHPRRAPRETPRETAESRRARERESETEGEREARNRIILRTLLLYQNARFTTRPAGNGRRK